MPPTEQRQRNYLAGLPLALAIVASVIQAICIRWDRHTGIGVAFGLDISVGAIFCGHILISRIKRLVLSGYELALLGLIIAYLSLLTVPVMLIISLSGYH